MPLSPEKQAARRARIKRLQDSKVIRRKRCANDGELFTPTRLYPVQKFCCDNCRKEFHKNGGNAFGPLKVRLEGMIQKRTAELMKRLSKVERELIIVIARQNGLVVGTANKADAGVAAPAGGKTKSASRNAKSR